MHGRNRRHDVRPAEVTNATMHVPDRRIIAVKPAVPTAGLAMPSIRCLQTDLVIFTAREMTSGISLALHMAVDRFGKDIVQPANRANKSAPCTGTPCP